MESSISSVLCSSIPKLSVALDNCFFELSNKFVGFVSVQFLGAVFAFRKPDLATNPKELLEAFSLAKTGWQEPILEFLFDQAFLVPRALDTFHKFEAHSTTSLKG
jgi:hypothetical protein